jgi:hypothetical protein
MSWPGEMILRKRMKHFKRVRALTSSKSGMKTELIEKKV